MSGFEALQLPQRENILLVPHKKVVLLKPPQCPGSKQSRWKQHSGFSPVLETDLSESFYAMMVNLILKKERSPPRHGSRRISACDASQGLPCAASDMSKVLSSQNILLCPKHKYILAFPEQIGPLCESYKILDHTRSLGRYYLYFIANLFVLCHTGKQASPSWAILDLLN